MSKPLQKQEIKNYSPDEILAANGKSFYWARHFLGSDVAKKATQLYAFCRYLDDIADGDAPGGLDRLHAIDEALLNGSPKGCDAPLIDNFFKLACEEKIPVQAARDLLSGLIFDQGAVLINDENALIRYSYQVAGSVGLMMSRLLGRCDIKADAFAVDMGIAMQLTNIARDVREDASLGRRYVPASWCGELSPEEISRGVSDAESKCRLPIMNGIAKSLAKAEAYYASGFSGLAYLPWRSDLAIGIGASVYRGIGRQLKRRKYAWWQ